MTPLVLLGVVALASLASRAVWVETPRTLVFDERYYVNAARTILGQPVPPQQPYFGVSPGTDPNLEHPPLGKLLIAGGMHVLGDRPLGWRAASLVFGTAAVLAMYWMVRSAGGGAWLALGASAVMTADNLFLVHGRIATLDVFAVAFMLAGAALYLRRRPLLAGVLLGVGACTKIVVGYVLVVLAVLELLRVVAPEHDQATASLTRLLTRLRPLSLCGASATVAFLAALALLDARYTIFENPIAHTRYMLGYAGNQHESTTAPKDVTFAPTSNPVQWLANREPIVYYRSAPEPPGRPRVLFQGRISPLVIYLAIPAFLVAAWGAGKARDDVSRLAVAWCLGTFVTFVVVALDHRYNYLYYMVVVLPGVYLAIARLFASRHLPRALGIAYAMALVYGVWVLYPVRSWSAW